MTAAGAERARLAEDHAGTARWKRWGPYVSLRQWGTVREDYTADGDAWNGFPHEHARSRAYRWGEDGLAGVSDQWQHLCFGLALWNGVDPILKERLYGLTNSEGNHGEDVKEHWWPLDSTPTHSYMRWLYRYPQAEFPYADLAATNRSRSRDEPEYELTDTGALDDGRFFDVEVTYAKDGPEDLNVSIACTNRGPERAVLHLLPTLWFRNTWAWGRDDRHPGLRAHDDRTVAASHRALGDRWLSCSDDPVLLFTDNETNTERLYGTPSGAPWVKDGINDHVVNGKDSVNPGRTGTKASAWYVLDLAPGETVTRRLRLSDAAPATDGLNGVEAVVDARRAEADDFYADLLPTGRGADEVAVHRLAMAGLLWTKQYYCFHVGEWLEGDPASPRPPHSRLGIRNAEWKHLGNTDVISMPDGWEYPWYAAWDLAFHMVPMAQVDAEFAKEQLVLLCREWYMHPNGQLPAYEWAFDDTNPPVHAWAAYRVFKIDAKRTGVKDHAFLERVFHKLLINFTWWVNRKDADGRNVFAGGFLGLDNIGLFDRSKPLPGGGRLDQADGTSWMAMYALNMLAIALELAVHNRAYEDVATKFFEHFLGIAHALNTLDLWDEADGFFYDVLQRDGREPQPLKVRSAVGLVPLFAVHTVEREQLDALPDFSSRMRWFFRHEPELCANVFTTSESDGRHMLSVLGPDRLRRVMRYVCDEAEFLSPYGLRSLSKHHEQHPVSIDVEGETHGVGYEPGESLGPMFGGNSNWRGPVWFPINYLVVESLQKYDAFLGPDYRVELPTGSGVEADLSEVAAELSRRLIDVFVPATDGRRPVNGGRRLLDDDLWREHVTFNEYFHGDTGAGLGASHQTGWTALVAKLIAQSGR